MLPANVLKALHVSPSQSCGVSPVTWDHTVLPATQHRFIYLFIIWFIHTLSHSQ